MMMMKKTTFWLGSWRKSGDSLFPFSVPPLSFFLSWFQYLFIFLLYYYNEGTHSVVMVLFSMKRETRR